MDLTRIDGVDVMVAQTVINEVGLDTSHWKTEAHFTSWLGECASSGSVNAAKKPDRGAVPTLTPQAQRSQSITAMAHRLAQLVCRMLKYGQHYVDKGAECYEWRNRQQQIGFLRKRAAQLGLQVTPPHA